MGRFNPAVSEYILNAEAFAQPMLIELRAIVHSFCPEVEETLKWSMPHFVYRGENLCNMASFTQHCAFGFWLAAMMRDEYGIFQRREQGGMGDLGKMRTMEDIPGPEKLGPYVLQAMQLIEGGVKLPRTAAQPQKALVIPDLLKDALSKEPAAQKTFDGFTDSCKREYVNWINEAKTEATRIRRLETTIENLLEGKTRDWKYKK